MELEKLILAEGPDTVAAFIAEPVQGAGGVIVPPKGYFEAMGAVLRKYDVLFVDDEVICGFGRTGKLFALEHAGVEPDILCLGKALTGGYMTLAATLCNDRISVGISEGEARAFMHGPTFMANPLACATAIASIELLLSQPWQRIVLRLQNELAAGLAPARELAGVADVRTLGAIGVIELKEPVDMKKVQPMFVERGVWVRPFGKLVYTMPPYVTSDDDLAVVTSALVDAVAAVHG